MTVVIRFSDEKRFVEERFIGIVHVPNTGAKSLKDALETLLSGLGCVSQKFEVKVSRIVCFLRSSNKRHALLHTKQVSHFANIIEQELVEIGTGLNQELSIARPGDTRWGSHFRTLCRLKDLFTPIIEVFEELEDDRDSEGEPQCLLLIMKTFRFVFMLHLMVDVLSVTNDLSEALQMGDQDIVNVMELVEINKKTFQKMREDGWEGFYEKVVSSCGNLEITVRDMDVRYDVTDNELSSQLENYIQSVKMDDNFSKLKGISDLSKTLVRTKKQKTFRFVYKLVKLAFDITSVTYVEKEVFSTIDDMDIIKRFQAMSKRKMQLPS
ncbi:hypothetical protein LIER_10230 [Lithospermum erythrorhizon]|uniref:DUF4371 domain-containing protein n=1 Tax=Lithospermum erythrorhizon TaxID=34254 RepID=A0AAV3PK84_LITER